MCTCHKIVINGELMKYQDIFRGGVIAVLLLCLGATMGWAEENRTLSVNATAGNETGNHTATESIQNLTGNSTIMLNETPSSDLDTESDRVVSGVAYPSGGTDLSGSTPDRDPFAGQYATGGVSVDFSGHLMEGRGNDSNVSSEIIFHDHTDAQGYIRTLIKDFHYVSSIDTPQKI